MIDDVLEKGIDPNYEYQFKNRKGKWGKAKKSYLI
jgi:hypothetical protein